MRALLTGFEPFGGDKINPSELVVKRISGEKNVDISGLEIYTAVLPVSFRRAGVLLKNLFDDLRPDIYIGLGQWAGISYVTLERIGVNIKDARTPDNDGEQPIDEPIDPDGPVAYFTTLPKRAIVKRLREAGIPSAISNTAGAFLCNYVIYLSLHHSALKGYLKRAGFMHLPLLPEQAAHRRSDWPGIAPSMSLDTMVKAVEIALKTTIELFDKSDEKTPI